MNDDKTHSCEHMMAALGVNQQNDYSYKWEDHHGWSLYKDGEPYPNHRWCIHCDWCSLPFASFDAMSLEVKKNPLKQHRCHGNKYDDAM